MEALDGRRAMNVEALVVDFFDAGKRAALSKDREELHKFRIAAKRLRYTIEILDPKGGGDWLRRLKVVQEELGNMNDAFVAEQFLRDLPSRSLQARPLPAKLRAEAHAYIAAFQKTWQRRFGARTEKAWLTWARSVEE
jgi:CHAD domain-containing protein